MKSLSQEMENIISLGKQEGLKWTKSDGAGQLHVTQIILRLSRYSHGGYPLVSHTHWLTQFLTMLGHVTRPARTGCERLRQRLQGDRRLNTVAERRMTRNRSADVCHVEEINS